jgi:catechol 2,3-dioxygenase
MRIAGDTTVKWMAIIDPGLRIASATLAVGDLSRSVDFYERALGLPLHSRDLHEARLGPDRERPALVLRALDGAEPLPPGSTGLYHVAWLHPSRASLAETVRRVLATGWRFDGASDHGVSEALYLSDPDGLGIELYADRPRERWQRAADGRSIDMVTLPLDLEDLLAQSEAEPASDIDPDTGIGHVHLKVADVPAATGFYGGTLGFERQAALPSAAFLSAGGYHHHIGLNSWQSAGGSAAGEQVPGLRLVEFALPGEGSLEQLERAVHDAGGEDPVREDGVLLVRDPDGQRLAFAQG